MFVMAFLSTMMLLSVCVCVFAWLSLGNTHREQFQGLAFRPHTVCNKAMFINSKG